MPRAQRRGAQLVEAQLVGTGARRRNDVGDADPEPEHQFAIWFAHAIADLNQAQGDAGCVQRRPEAVAATGEVSIDGSSPETRVDPDEQEPDAIVDEVVDKFSMQRSKLCSSELHHLPPEMSEDQVGPRIARIDLDLPNSARRLGRSTRQPSSEPDADCDDGPGAAHRDVRDRLLDGYPGDVGEHHAVASS